MRRDLTAGRLRELFAYNRESGVFTRRVARGTSRIGELAGTKNRAGYWQISIDGSLYYAHRLAWLYVHGEWPSGEIDHINRARSDNSITNLRDVSKALNGQNRHKQANNKTGFKGVSMGRRGAFMACIRVQGKTIHLGSRRTAEAAHAAYAVAAAKHHHINPEALV